MKKLAITSKEISHSSENINQTTYIGIDFGTSTTVVSLAYFDWQEKQVKTQTLRLNQKLSDGAIYKSDKIPSMIAWHGQQLLVGEGASQIRLKKTKDKNLWYAFKMDLGKKNDYLYSASELVKEGKKIVNGKDATTLFFKYLYQQINKYLRENKYPEQVHYSISIPASFEPNQRKDMLDALKANHFEFKEQAFIDEPNAAFLSYISDPELQQNIHLSDEFNSNILVFDYGAGTCDISIMEVGIENHQLRSSNLAISKFDFIGGKEIDRLIASDVLLPQLREENNLGEFSLSTSVIKKYIIPKLERYAELLKITASKTLSLAWNNIDLDKYENHFTTSNPIEFITRKGTYAISKPSMSFAQFRSIMEIITNRAGDEAYRNNKNERFVSIFNPIHTALEKAELDTTDIDYVLFIGGSAKNPLIQQAVKEYFPDSEYLIPRDLQAHVSAGAAVNSLLYNGFNERVINPITNEPIFLIVNKSTDKVILECNDDEEDPWGFDFEDNDTSIIPIIPAGATIPSHTVTLSNLRITDNSQEQIELPICLTDKSNIIYNLVIPCDGVSIEDPITLAVTIDANRTIHANATVKGISKRATIENAVYTPTTAKERVEKAEAELSKQTSCNKGNTPTDQLYKLYLVYKAEGELLKAAEVAEDLYKHHNRLSLNHIGLLYSDAEDREKAIYFYKKHLEQDKSAPVWFNLACKYQYTDYNEYVRCLEQSLAIDPEHRLARYKLLKHQIANNPSNSLKNQLNELFSAWQSEYETGQYPHHISWLISCAKATKNFDYARKLEQTSESNTTEFIYNSQNLVTAK